MVYSLVGAKAASTIGTSTPDINTHVNVMKSLGFLFRGEADDLRIKREKKVCGCVAIIRRPLEVKMSNFFRI